MKAIGIGWAESGGTRAPLWRSAAAGWLARRDAMIAVIAALFAIQAAIRFTSHLGSDVSWYLYAGGRLLDGGVLYKDVVEVNPPLGVWLAALVAGAARAIGVGPAILLKALLLALTAISVWVSARLIAAARDLSAGTCNVLLVLIAALLLFLPGADFGQRDHVLILLVCPWVLLRWNRLTDEEVPLWLAAAVGLAAAIGFWLKPHFLFAAFAVELSVALAIRSARGLVHIETLIVAGFGAAYLVTASSLFPRDLVVMSSFSTKAFIPFYGQGVEAVALRLVLPSLLAALAVAATRLLSSQMQLLRALLLAAGAAFLFVFVVQAGYVHQVMPATFFLALAVGLGAARVIAGEAAPTGLLQRLTGASSVIAVAGVLVAAGATQFVGYRGAAFEEAIAREAPEAGSIFIASTSVSHPFPLVEEKGLMWASRFPSQWFAPFLATTLDQSGSPADMMGQSALEATVSDFVDFAPDVVFIDENPVRPHFRGRPLDYVAFWSHDTRFPVLWKSYEKRGVVEGFGIYVRRR